MTLYKRHTSNIYYQLYWHIKSKCYNKRFPDFKYYGARGITLFEEWLDDFDCFVDYIIKELGPRPNDMSLDRINNNGNYEPGNLRWATPSQQASNQRKPITKVTRTNTQEKYITWREAKKRFVVQINRRYICLYSASFLTLKEAIIARDNFITKEIK